MTPEQRAVLEQNYARHDDECVQRVKQLYKDLNIEKVRHGVGSKDKQFPPISNLRSIV